MASNYDMLKVYFESAKDLPYRGGQPNKTAIAKEAGCAGRQPFYDNEGCMDLLEKWVTELPARNKSGHMTKEARLSKENRELAGKNAKLFAEAEELRRKLRKAELTVEIFKTGRRPQS